MKPPKNEPYQRSRHRAALHAWVVAATTVASIGMSSAAFALEDDTKHELMQRDAQSPAQDAQRVASHWIEALQLGDMQAAMSMIRLPGSEQHQQAVQTDLDVLADLLAQQDVRIEPVAHRHVGHWAMSAWAMDLPEVSIAPVIEPIALYHPASDALFESSANWQVMPQNLTDDPALTPLYNADYDELQAWFQTLL